MTDTRTTSQLGAAIPADDPDRRLAVADPEDISDKTARLLCMCTPPGQELFFLAVGDPVDSRNAPPPKLSPQEQAERIQRAKALAPQYRTELLV